MGKSRGFFLVCLMAAGDVRGQPPGDPQFEAFMNGDVHRDLIMRALDAVPAVEFQRCAGLVAPGAKVRVIRPFSYGAGGRPEAGVWKEAFPVRGCGNDTILNFYFIVMSDGKINTLIGVPGGTIADLRVQRDGLLYAEKVAARRAWMCKEFVVSNSFFKGFGSVDPPIADPGAGAVYRPWWEIWVLNGCGQRYEVRLSFVPDGAGTRIIGPEVGAEKE